MPVPESSHGDAAASAVGRRHATTAVGWRGPAAQARVARALVELDHCVRAAQALQQQPGRRLREAPVSVQVLQRAEVLLLQVAEGTAPPGVSVASGQSRLPSILV